MRIFALGDLHLGGNSDKPMDVFGPAWDSHQSKIESAWRSAVSGDDIVLIPGDISWAMRLEDARDDLAFIGSLPGKKLILRGNHDYWWSSLTKVRAALDEGVFALQNDAFTFGPVTIAGSRGWTCPGSVGFAEAEDRPIYERELIRFEMSLAAAGRAGGELLIAMLHYPPFNEKRQRSGFTELAEAAGAKHIVYGHLHDKACLNAFEGEREGIKYTLCSADHLRFAPALIAEV